MTAFNCEYLLLIKSFSCAHNIIIYSQTETCTYMVWGQPSQLLDSYLDQTSQSLIHAFNTHPTVLVCFMDLHNFLMTVIIVAVIWDFYMISFVAITWRLHDTFTSPPSTTVYALIVSLKYSPMKTSTKCYLMKYPRKHPKKRPWFSWRTDECTTR